MCIGVGIGAIVVTTIAKMFWSISSYTLENKIRKDFFRAILNQDCAWYDILDSDKITQLYNMEGNSYARGLGPTNQMLFFDAGLVISGLFFALSTAVIYTCICLSLVPLMFIGIKLWVFAITAGTTLSKSSYVKAGSLSEQAISGIRTVKSLCGEEKEFSMYKQSISQAKSILVKFGF